MGGALLDQVGWTILTAVTGVGGYLLRGYLSSYVSEKGKNLATKEDISQITAQVEGVKASVQVLAHLKTSYEEQRREWALAFYDSAVEMLYEKIGARLGDFPYDDGRSLHEFQTSFKALVVSMLKEYQRMVIYFDHEDPVRESAEEVLNLALKLDAVFKQRFSAVKLAIRNEGTAHLSGSRDRYSEAVEKTDAASRAYWNDMDPVATAFRESLRQFLSLLNRFLKESSTGETASRGT